MITSDSWYQIRITLQRTRPPIWRRLQVPASLRLDQLHDVIQIAMGWEGLHLHCFRQELPKKPRPPKVTSDRKEGASRNRSFQSVESRERIFDQKWTPWGDPIDSNGEDESQFALCDVCPDVKSKIVYEYDFGDDWRHDIEVQKILPTPKDPSAPVCQAGKLACPIEDCGGIYGYYNLLDAQSNPRHPDHEELLEMYDKIDPIAFDIEEVNKNLKRWWWYETGTKPYKRREPRRH